MPQPPIPRLGIDALARRAAFAIHRLARRAVHALPPLRHHRIIRPPARALGPGGIGPPRRGRIHLAAARGGEGAEIVEIDVPAVGQYLRRRLPIPLLHLLHHGVQLPMVGPGVGDRDPDNDLPLRRGHELRVERRPVPAIWHLHHPRVRIRRRQPRRPLHPGLPPPRFQRRQLRQRLRHPLPPLLPRPGVAPPPAGATGPRDLPLLGPGAPRPGPPPPSDTAATAPRAETSPRPRSRAPAPRPAPPASAPPPPPPAAPPRSSSARRRAPPGGPRESRPACGSSPIRRRTATDTHGAPRTAAPLPAHSPPLPASRTATAPSESRDRSAAAPPGLPPP